jgi:peptidoglycan/LPS O-acetylase OafA/YrhL
VLILHAREIVWVGMRETWIHRGFAAGIDGWLGYLSMPFRFGRFGVMLFFVISGFCIHRPNAVALRLGHGLELKAFFMRRIQRIYPTLIAALVLTAVTDALVRSRFPYDPKLGDDRAQTFLVNMLTLQNLAGPTYGSNGPLWSLSLEEHIYALYPVLYALSVRVGVMRVVVYTMIVTVGAVALGEIRPALLLDFLPYWGVWTAGMAVAEMEGEGIPTWAHRFAAPAAGLALIAAIALSLLGHYVASDVLLGVPFAWLVLWSTTPRGQILWGGRIGRAVARVGIFSYSLYATHLPLLVLFRVRSGWGALVVLSLRSTRVRCVRGHRVGLLSSCRAPHASHVQAHAAALGSRFMIAIAPKRSLLGASTDDSRRSKR